MDPKDRRCPDCGLPGHDGTCDWRIFESGSSDGTFAPKGAPKVVCRSDKHTCDLT